MRKSLYIIGAGSVGGHIAWNYDDYGLDYTLAGFLDDDPSKIGTNAFGLDVIGPVEAIFTMQNVAVVIGIAFPEIKKKIVDKIATNTAVEFPTLVSSKAWISNGCTIGQGSIIYPGVSVNYGTILGDFIVMNMNCAIGHDVTIDDYSSLAPGVNLAGHTHIEAGVDLGIGSATRQDVRIGKGSVIGGQSMVIKVVPPGSVYAGVPARELK